MVAYSGEFKVDLLYLIVFYFLYNIPKPFHGFAVIGPFV